MKRTSFLPIFIVALLVILVAPAGGAAPAAPFAPLASVAPVIAPSFHGANTSIVSPPIGDLATAAASAVSHPEQTRELQPAPLGASAAAAGSDQWNTFLGGYFPNPSAIALDGSGNTYVIGVSDFSWGAPVRPYAGGNNDVLVAKLSPDGLLMWHTFLGASVRAYDYGSDIAVDGGGNVYVTGSSAGTWGENIISPFHPSAACYGSSCEDAFVAKLNNNGELLWNTFLGATAIDWGYGIAVDASGAVFVTGDSAATWGSPLFTYGGGKAFVAKLSTAGELVWNGFLDMSGQDVAVDHTGVYFTGTTSGYYGYWGSPIRPPSDYGDAWVDKLSSDGVLLWHTYLGGGGGDWGYGVAADGNGYVYVTGSSSGTWGEPVRAFSSSSSTNDAFVAKLDSAGALQWNTFLGSSANDEGSDAAADGSGNVYVTGWSNGMWATPVFPLRGWDDAFVARLDSTGALVWNTFLGSTSYDEGRGIAVDAAGSQLTVGGQSMGAWQMDSPPVRSFAPRYTNDGNIFVARLPTDFSGWLLVGIGGPAVASPGQTISYGVYYANRLTTTVTSAVLVAQLPVATEYVDSSGGGIYWPERHQVFWKLGDLAPETGGSFSVRARYTWGLPDRYYGANIVLLAGTNYGQADLDVTPYLNFDPVSITGESLLSEADLAAERAAHPDLEILYNRATAAGFTFLEAASFTLSTGDVVTQTVLLKPDRSAAVFLSQQGDSSESATLTRTTLTIEDTTGGVTADRQTHALEFFGSWAPTAAAQARASSGLAAGCDYETCRNNCAVRKVTTRVVKAGVSGVLGWVFSAIWPPAGALAGGWQVISLVRDVLDCTGGCEQDPATHCCTQDLIKSTTHPLTGDPACELWKCADSVWDVLPEVLPCGGWDTRCVAAGGCRPCSLSSTQASSAGAQGICAVAAAGGAAASCGGEPLRVARDPNAKYGPEGDLLPGQLITYTITYENEGTGPAFGVYITDQLDEDLNETTLTIQGAGVFQASSRMIVWDIGELGPKGDPDSKGQVSFTIRLKNDLLGGTAITNEAVVYFPSVPEKTPTGMVVNTVQPVTAVPQAIETLYGQPVTVTLVGHDVGDATLTYTVTASPLHGELGGVAPTLVYTPAVNFSGGDRLTFRVSNGVSDSRPADVLITVQPSATDTISPTVTWVEPAAGATGVEVAVTPFVSDTNGALYRPAIAIVFSETMSRTTVNTDTLRLVADNGWSVPITITYDGSLNMATIYPQEALLPSTVYTVSVTSDAQDQAGNGLATAQQWSFSTQPMTAEISQTDHAAVVSWQDMVANASYQLWRSTSPHFVPGAGGSTPIAAGMPPTPHCTLDGSSITCTDPDALAGAGSYFYLVQAHNAAGATIVSNQTGAFSFALQPGE